MPTTGYDLGPFSLTYLAGRGATARVWGAVHRDSGLPVAVKILTRGAENPAYAEAFAREVRAVARLDHPAIIRLHDYGTLPDGLGPALDETVPEHAPYVVMDWHGGGTLVDLQRAGDFAAIRTALLTVLDALSHAHARGVVHRDLKPANVLMGARGPVLSDFGLVFGRDAVEAGGPQASGTPNFMAPEQVSHDWRSFGPWTDLYALGCLAWALATGRAPFAGQGVNRIMLHHLNSDPPAFAPRIAVPEAFEPWVRRLLAKAPGRRFAFAADAALALMDMPLPDAVETGPLPDPAIDATLLAPPVFVSIDEQSWRGAGERGDRPPRPSDWRRPATDPGPYLGGCGRALAELRLKRLRGRGAERDGLWALLGEVVEGGGARAALIEGAPGIGKSRLTAWLAARAHELGQAETLWVEHGPVADARHGLRPIFARALNLLGLEPDVAAERIRRRLGVEPSLAAALGALQSPTLHAAAAGFAITLSPRDIAQTIIDGLLVMAAARPLVVVVDDVQWDEREATLDLVTRVLDRHPQLPILFALSARPTAGAPMRRLAKLAARRTVLHVALGPLDAADQGRSVVDRLALDAATRDRLVQVTAGHPLFADALLRHWLHTGALEPTAQGYRLAERGPQPPTLGHLLRLRVETLLADITPDPLPALELAAVAGTTVDPEIWGAALEQAGMAEPRAAVERLLDAGLLRLAQRRLVFDHGLVGEALRARAQDNGRLARWHGIFAAGLQIDGVRRGVAPDPQQLAAHFEAAGQPGAAFAQWRAAVDAAEDAWGAVTAADAHLLAGALRTGRAMGLRHTDARWLDVKISWSAHLNGQRRGLGLRHARQAATRALAAHPVDRRIAARALRQHARCLRDKGNLAAADARLVDAEALAEAADDLVSLGATRRQRSMIAILRGDLDTAQALLANLLKRLADRAVPRDGKRRYQVVEAWNQLGEIHRRRGDLDRARDAYARSLRALGPDRTFLPALVGLNLALIDLERGQVDAARERALAAHPRMVRAGNPRYRIYAEAVLLACAGHAGDADAWDAAWRGLGPVRALDFVYLDVARMLEQAGRAAAQSLPARAAAARAVAARQYRTLGRPDDADAVEAGA